MLKKMGLSEVECRTREDFQRFLAETKTDTNWKKRSDVDMLEQFCDRAKRFEILIPNSKERLRYCYEKQVLDSFQSYSDQVDAEGLKTVGEYEAMIKINKDKIEKTFQKLDEDYNEYQLIVEPFVLSYLGDVKKVAVLIEQCLNTVAEICETIKKWYEQDKNYPRKLWDETLGINSQRGGSCFASANVKYHRKHST